MTGAASLTVAYSLTGAEVVARAGFGTAAARCRCSADPDTAALAVDGVLDVNVGARLPIAGHRGRRAAPVPGRRIAVRGRRRPGAGRPPRRPRPGHRLGQRALARGRAGSRRRRRAGPRRRSTCCGSTCGRTGRPGSPAIRWPSARPACLPAARCSPSWWRLLALVLLVVAERRDESAQLYAWESDGVSPAHPAPVAVPACGRGRGGRRARRGGDRAGAIPNHHRPGPGDRRRRHRPVPPLHRRDSTVDGGGAGCRGGCSAWPRAPGSPPPRCASGCPAGRRRVWREPRWRCGRTTSSASTRPRGGRSPRCGA